MTNHEPKHPPADMAGLDDLIWRIKERMPIDHTEMLALAARVEVLEAALRFYADENNPHPNDGPWGVDSSDFGNIARAALKGAEG